MIVVIDLGLGNINSVSGALKYLDFKHCISCDPSVIKAADQLILPGVGNFFEASRRLHSSSLVDDIRNQILNEKKPFLGICLGMQLLAEHGEEGGISEGLGIFKATIRRLKCEKDGYRLPHIGWNDVIHNGMTLFSDIPDCTPFYFVHSYSMVIDDASIKYATSNYGMDFVAAIHKDNVCGTQFHPEKSQTLGLKLLKNFVTGKYKC